MWKYHNYAHELIFLKHAKTEYTNMGAWYETMINASGINQGKVLEGSEF